MKRLSIKDPSPKRGANSEEILCFVTYVEEEDHWGEFEVFRGSSWEKVVSVVPADDFSHALHGMVDPLLRSLGREPISSLKRIKPEEGECANKNVCIGWDKGFCLPGGCKGKGKTLKWGPPECYEPPLQGATPSIINVFSEVLLALREGFYIVVVKGKGFNFS